MDVEMERRTEVERMIQAPAFLREVATLSRKKGALYVCGPTAGGFVLGASLSDRDVLSAPVVVSMLAERVAYDLDELRLAGDTTSKDSLLAMCDGSRKLGKPVRLGLCAVEKVYVQRADDVDRVSILLRVVA